jgi:hypothetical protein
MERSAGEAQQPKAANIGRRGPQHDCGSSPPPTNVHEGFSRLPPLGTKGSAPKAKAPKKSSKRRTTRSKPKSRSR